MPGVNSKTCVEWLDKAVVFFSCALIYFLPISISLVEVFSGFVILCFLVKKFILAAGEIRASKANFFAGLKIACRSFYPPNSVLNIPLGLFIGFSFISVMISQDVSLSMESFFSKLLQGYFLYLSVYESFQTRRQIMIFVSVWCVSTLLVSISGLIQYLSGVDFLRGHLVDMGRATSSLRHPNDLGAYLLFMALGIFSVVLAGDYRIKASKNPGKFYMPGPIKTFLYFIFILIILCLGATFSRGAWVGFFAALLFLGFTKKEVFLSILFFLVAFVLIYQPLLRNARNVSFITDDVSAFEQKRASESSNIATDATAPGTANLEKEGMPEVGPVTAEATAENPVHSASNYIVAKLQALSNMGAGQGRMEYWITPITIIRDFPLFGVGLNAYSIVAPTYKLQWSGYPHNCYLQIAAEIGLVGLLAFMIFIGCFFAVSLRNLRKIHDAFLRALLAGLLSGFFGFLTQSFFDTTLYSVQLANLMWIAIALSLAIQKAADLGLVLRNPARKL